MRIGLDFGTTNTSAAVFDGERVRLLDLDPVNRSPEVMRTVLFITRDGAPFIGREAIDRFSEGNVGRVIDYEWTYIGKAVVTFADVGTVDQALFTLVDRNTPGRLFQSLKSHLPDVGFSETSVFGTRYSLEALIAVILRAIRRRAEAVLGEPVTGLVVGRPVNYTADGSGNDLALERMRRACELADLPDVTFLPEPTAAAYAYARTAPADQAVLVLDFGGGTFDVTVLRTDGRGGLTVLATDGVPVGGDLFDRRLAMGTVLPHFGAGARLGQRGLPMPHFIYEQMSHWQGIFELNLPRYLKVLEEAVRTGDKPRQLRALHTLVRQNYGLPLYEAVEQAKVRLSAERITNIVMHVPGISFVQEVAATEFDGLIGADLRAVLACIDRAVAAADLRPDQIDVVLRTGGSSRVAAYVRQLAERFGAAKLHEMDTFTGVASGLAIAARQESALTAATG